MLRIKRVDRFCGWMSAFFLLMSFLFAGCFAVLETTQDGETQVNVQAISPLPTALAILPPESTPQPSPSPTFYWPPPPDVTRKAQRGASPTPSATPSKIVNLAEGLPDGEIYVCYVLRADGTVEQYRLPVKPLEVAENFIDARNEFLNLKLEDKVINGYSLATPPAQQVPFP